MSDTRYFQFLVGERKGEVVIFDKIIEEDDMVFISFKDQSRCNEELILPLNDFNWSNQLMAEVSNPDNVWRFKEEWVGRIEEKWEKNADQENVCVQPLVEGRKKVTPIPPRFARSKFGAIEETRSNSISNINVNKKHELENDPVWIMMDKAKKFDTEVSMILTISLPTKSLYEVAKESFTDGDKKVIEYIINKMDDKKLKEDLSIALKKAYEGENYLDKTELDFIKIENELKNNPNHVNHGEPIMIKKNEDIPNNGKSTL